MENYRQCIQKMAEELELTSEEVTELYRSYISDVSACIIDLKSLLEESAWDKISNVAHTIKGMAGNLMLEDIYKKTYDVNLILNEKRKHYPKELIIDFIEFLQISQEIISSSLRDY